jgi:8-oxo-dGTP pyrophosphatase MutT (NUDIX family)
MTRRSAELSRGLGAKPSPEREPPLVPRPPVAYAQAVAAPFQKVQVWIHRAGPQGKLEVLLLLLTPDRGGYWQPVTGGVDAGESLQAAAAREAREESGLPFTALPKPLDYCFRFFSSKHQVECEEHAFELEIPAAATLKVEVRLDAREHVAFEWVEASAALKKLKHASNADALKLLIARKVAASPES